MLPRMRCSARTFLPLLALVTTAASIEAADPQVFLVAPTEALPAARQQKMFHLPPGFDIELIAEDPVIRKPINMSFDAAGQLYVTQSIEYPFPAKEGTPRDTIHLFRDTNGDGVPDKASIFADGLNIPIGVLPLADGTVLGYGIPNIFRFEDTDGDGQADRRDVLFSTFGFDDTHGMANSFTWTLDGWVHACHGFRNTSSVQGADRNSITMNSGNTYRFRTDGSHIEYYTHGQVNPFGMASDPLGNLYTADCHSRPIYMLLRGATYPSFGKPHDGLGFGPEMIAHSHGSTGICGVVYYDAVGFPAEYRNTVFIGNPVTGRINHDRLAAHGSSYTAIEQPDFLTCDDPWFRPVDIKLAPDGSLYIADFYNCIIGHYEVDLHHPRRDRLRGRIWRIVYRGEGRQPAPKAPNLKTAGIAELIAALEHENITLRTQAVHHLVQRVGSQSALAVRSVVESGSALQRAHGLWVLARLGELTGADITRLAADPDRLVRVQLAQALAGLNWDLLAADPRKLLFGLLQDSDPFVRRAAADVLGQHPAQDNVAPLLALWQATPADDTHLVHMTRISLRDSLASLDDLTGITGEYSRRPDEYRRLAEIVLGVNRPSAGPFLLDYLKSPALDAGRVADFMQHAAAHLPADKLPELYAHALALRSGQNPDRQVAVLRALHRALEVRALPLPVELRTWAIELTGELLATAPDGPARAGIDLARDLRLTETAPALAKLCVGGAPAARHRQPALEGLTVIDGPRAVPLLGKFVEDGAEPIAARQKGAELLGSVNSAESRAELLRLLRTAPDQVALAIARALATGADGGQALLALVGEGKASARLLQDVIVTERLKGARLPDLDAHLSKLLQDLPTEDERFRQLLAARQAGYGKASPSPVKGAAVFEKICANCHRVAGKGGKVGPELDGIGVRGLDRLLEDILLPSRNVDQAFRASTIALADGKSVTGLLLREEGEVLVIADETGKEIRIAKTTIDEQRVMRVSPMPANIAEQLGDGDFYDLISYLLTLKNTTAAPTP
jgi:putative heme-binding domain-containing protein